MVEINTTIRGRSAGMDGHGERDWSESVAFLVNGRAHGGIGRAISPRPNLGHDLVLGLQDISNGRQWEQTTFRVLVGSVSEMFVCFDSLESKTAFSFNGGVEDLAGQPWLFFKNWLEAKRQGSVLSRIYGQCKRVVEAAVRRKFGQLPPNFHIPPNPFPQDKFKGNWDRTDDMEDDEYTRIGDALVLQLKAISERLARGRHLLPEAALRVPKDGLSDQSLATGDLAIGDQDARDALAAYGPLWEHLIAYGRLPKTAVVHELELLTFDRYPNQLKHGDLGIEADHPGEQLRRPAIELRIAILRAVLEVDIPFNQDGADLVGVDLRQLRAQSRSLIKRGALEHIWINQGNQHVRAAEFIHAELHRYEVAHRGIDAKLLGIQEQLRILRRALPTHEELRCALAMVLLRTGWNESTVGAMKADDWHRPHPIHGASGTYVDMYSNKSRAGGRPQYADSSTNRSFSAYDVILRVLTWTEPLRVLLDQQMAALQATLKAADPPSKMKLLVEVRRLKELRNRIWLTMLDDGRIAQLDPRWNELNDMMKALGVTRTDGSEVRFTQAMTRRAWAIFNYERSGANLFLTKLALGHSDFGSVMAYIASQKELNKQRMKWVGLQTALLKTFGEGGATTPAALRTLIGKAGLSAAEAARVLDGSDLTRKGMACANPLEPDAHVDPKHKPGRLCGTQNCLDGCSKSFVTFDTAVYLAREVARLQELREKMSVIAWGGSEYPDQLEAAEAVFKGFSEGNRKIAQKEVLSRRPRVIFGLPSIQARLAATSSGRAL